MPTITAKELRDNLADVLRRAEAGEEVTITLSGRPVAVLGAVPNRRWVSGADLRRVFETPPPQTLNDDLERLRADLDEPSG